MLPIKNPRLSEIQILSNEVINMEENFKLFIRAINCEHDNDIFIYRIYYASIINALFRDNCYYGTTLLNDMSDIDAFMLTVNELNIYPYVRNTYRHHDKNHILGKLEIISSFFSDFTIKYYKKTFLEWLETVCLIVNERIRFSEVLLYPIFMEWDNFMLHIGYTSSNPAYERVILPTPEIYTQFVRTYYNSNFTETAPSNILHYVISELSNMVYGENIEEIIKRILTKTLETIELDKFDPEKSLYYVNLNYEVFSSDIYLCILNLLNHFHNYVSRLQLNETVFYISDVCKKSLTINYREGLIK